MLVALAPSVRDDEVVAAGVAELAWILAGLRGGIGGACCLGFLGFVHVDAKCPNSWQLYHCTVLLSQGGREKGERGLAVLGCC